MADIKVTIQEGSDFFAHEASVQFSPLHVYLDFKNITPRMDMRSKQRPTMVLKHSVVMLDVHHAEQLHVLLGKVLTDYKKEFGSIRKPKDRRKTKRTPDSLKKDTPVYLG